MSIQLNEDESNLVVSSLPVEEQIVFYTNQVNHAKEINNEVLYNYYLSRIKMIQMTGGLVNSEIGGSLEGGSNGFRRKN